jgi:hypothetical protein
MAVPINISLNILNLDSLCELFQRVGKDDVLSLGEHVKKAGKEHCGISLQRASIISGTGAAIWLKTSFEPTGHHYPRSRPLLHVCTVPSDSAIFLK